MRRTLIAADFDNNSALSAEFEILNPDIDLETAVRSAAGEYIRTETGYRTYIRNKKSFNWADFVVCVPNQICEKYGFRQIDYFTANPVIDMNEQLVPAPFFPITDIEWDVDDEEDACRLPKEDNIYFTELLHQNENLSDISLNELKDRIADFLSDKYEFCVCGFIIN